MPRQYTPRVALICGQCSQEFLVKASHASRARFCSMACRRPIYPVIMNIDDTANVPLWIGTSTVAHAMIDAADAAWVSQWRWSLIDGYAKRSTTIRGRSQHVSLHRELLGLKRGDARDGDHIDRDKLNCRRSNLRVLPKGFNSQNVPGQAGTSRYRGVHWVEKLGKWRAQIRLNGKSAHLGLFHSEVEAAKEAQRARLATMPGAVD